MNMPIAVRRAFTLVELLVVMAIIGILITIAVYVWSSVNARSRDNTRKLNLKQIQGALETYALDNRSYPAFVSEKCSQSGNNSPNGPASIYSATWQLTDTNTPLAYSDSPYLDTVPVDPLSKNVDPTSCNQLQQYLYVTNANSSGYVLAATLENKSDPDINTTTNSSDPFSATLKLPGYQAYYGTTDVPGYINPNYFIQGGLTR